MMHRSVWTAIAVIATTVGLVGCDEKPTTTVAPSATTLKDTKPKAMGAMDFAIDEASGKVGFEMDAPKEKIRGRVEKSMKGEIAIDPSDITKTTGHLFVDIGELELFQRNVDDAGELGAEEKNETQNEHAREWLEIGSCDGEKVEDAKKAECQEMTKKNRNVEFVITKVETDQKDITKTTGDERKITATVTGDFLLHQHKTQKTAKVEITFKMGKDKIESVHVETVEPFAVGLAEHDVRPREAFGIIAEKTLDVLAPKVAKEAAVSLAFDAKFAGMKGTAKGDERAEGQPAQTEPADAKPAEAPASGAY